MTGEEFRRLGYEMVDRVAALIDSLPERPVAPGESVEQVRRLLGRRALPAEGASAREVLDEASRLLVDHSLFNGHPRFWGFITASAAPIGALADLLASAVNPNVGGWTLSPMATEIEAQTVGWIAELLGLPASSGGLLVSGGNAANLVGFWTGRCAKAPWDVRAQGVAHGGRPLRVYTSDETHTWIQKAADLSGMGAAAIRWIPTDASLRMDVRALRDAIVADRRAGDAPIIVVGTAGSVSTGRGRSAAGDRRHLSRARSLVSRRRRLWRACGGAGRSRRRSASARARRFGRGRSAQVALRAARSRMRAGARPRAPARHVQLSSALLSRQGDRRGTAALLPRARAAEFARISRAEGVGRAAAGRTSRLRADDSRRHRARRATVRASRLRSAPAGVHTRAEHRHVPLRARRSRGRRRHRTRSDSARGSRASRTI